MDRRTRIILVGVMSALLIGAIAFMAWRAGRSTGYLTDTGAIKEPQKSAHPRQVLWEPPAAPSGAINTELEEYEPRVSADGVTLFFVRGKAGHNAQIYTSQWTPDGWSDPAPLDAVNTPADELGPQPSRDGRSLYFCSNREGGAGGYDVWVVRRDGAGGGGGGWREAVNLGPTVNTVFHEYSPTLSPLEQALYFASNRPRSMDPAELNAAPWSATLRENVGRHDYDLYVSALAEDGPAQARAVVALNSPANDGAPAFSPAGDFLYFSSDRVGPGAGGFDLYRSRLLRGEFQAPENLGSPINSEFHELDPSLSMAGFVLHFSTNRPLSAGVDADAAGSAAAADYNLLTSASREVFLEYERQEQTEVSWVWSPIWLKLLWMLLAALALLAAILLLRPGKLRTGRLSLLAKCLLASLIVHLILLFALNLWGVTTSLGEFFQKPGGHRVIVSGSGEGGDTGDGAGDITTQLRGGLTQFTVEASDAGPVDGPVLEIAKGEESSVNAGVERSTIADQAALVASGAAESSATGARTDPAIPEIERPLARSDVAIPTVDAAAAVREAQQRLAAQNPSSMEPAARVVQTQPQPVESGAAKSMAPDGGSTLSADRPDAPATAVEPSMSRSAESVAQAAPANVQQPQSAPARASAEGALAAQPTTVPSAAAPGPVVQATDADRVATSAPGARDVVSGAITTAAAGDARGVPIAPTPQVQTPNQSAVPAAVALPAAASGASTPERLARVNPAKPDAAAAPSTSVVAPVAGDSTVQGAAEPSSTSPIAGMAKPAAQDAAVPSPSLLQEAARSDLSAAPVQVQVPTAAAGASGSERQARITGTGVAPADAPSTSVVPAGAGDFAVAGSAAPSRTGPAAGMASAAAGDAANVAPSLVSESSKASLPGAQQSSVQVPATGAATAVSESQARPAGMSIAVVEAPTDSAVNAQTTPGLVESAAAPSRAASGGRLADTRAQDASGTANLRTASSGAEQAAPGAGQSSVAVPAAGAASNAGEASSRVSGTVVGSVDGPVGAVATQTASANPAIESSARPARVRGTSNLADSRASDAVAAADDRARAIDSGQRGASAPGTQQASVAMPAPGSGVAAGEVESSVRAAVIGSVQVPSAAVTETSPAGPAGIVASTARPAAPSPAGSLTSGRASDSKGAVGSAIAPGATGMQAPGVELGAVDLPRSADSSPGIATGEARGELGAASPTTLAGPSAAVASAPDGGSSPVATSAAPSRSSPSASLAAGSVRDARRSGSPTSGTGSAVASDVPLMVASETATPGSDGVDTSGPQSGARVAETGSQIGAPAAASLSRPSPGAMATIVDSGAQPPGPAGSTVPTREVGQASLAGSNVRESKSALSTAGNAATDTPLIIDTPGGSPVAMPQEVAGAEQGRGSEVGAVAGTSAAVAAASRVASGGPAVRTTIDGGSLGQETNVAAASPLAGGSLRGSGASDARTPDTAGGGVASSQGALEAPGAPAFDIGLNTGLELPTELGTRPQHESTGVDGGAGAGGMDIALSSKPRVDLQSLDIPSAGVETGAAPAALRPARLARGGDASGRDAPVYGADPGNARWGLRLPDSTTTDVAVPTETAAPEDPYKQRAPAIREEIVERLGGSDETEQAVATSLQWLAKHQGRDGRWDSTEFDDDCGACGGEPSIDSDTAVTGLALLCYLGADHTHMKQGQYRERVGRAIDWLLSQQGKDGDLRGGGTMYSHGIAAIAISEAYGMTKDEKLKEPVERAVAYIVSARNTVRGGWRYEPGQFGDTSVMGWQVMALESAKRAGLAVPASAFQGAAQWLAMVSEGSPGLYAYQPGQPPTPAMTAEGLFVRQLLGHRREEPMMRTSVRLIAQNPPDWSKGANTYYWYYATLAMFQEQGDDWPRWNSALTRTLLQNQRQDGPAAGSWDPADKWSTIGGRVYQTAICTLSLEVYYRYLPLYSR